MRTVYFGCGFKVISVIENLVDILRKDHTISENYNLVVPNFSECSFDSYVFSDLYYLDKADIFIFHISDEVPSIGTSMELAYFKTKYPHKLAIAYRSTTHGWVKHFSDIRTDSPSHIKDVLITQLYAHKIY